jgi:hypothetical protein
MTHLGILVAFAASGGCKTTGEQGRSSMEWLEPANPVPPKSGAKGDVSATNVVINDIPPTFTGDLAKPAYPAEALAAHAGDCVVFATITIDTKGSVTDVRPTWNRLSIPNRFSEQFLEAVRVAVRTWKFVPARNVYWEKNGDAEPKYLGTELISAQTDIKFTFEASGKVR